MKKLAKFWPEILLLSAAGLLLFNLCGCAPLTREQQAIVKTTTGAAGAVVGLPPWVGESIGGIIIAAIGAFAGHKHGRRKERACKATNAG